MLRRIVCLGIAVAVLLPVLSGCNKSEGSDPPNQFGPAPDLTEVLVTKERRNFRCTSTTDLCLDPTFLCFYLQVDETEVEQDLVTASARVTDASGSANILVVVARFLDPPLGVGSGRPNQLSLEMFDNGPAKVGSINTGSNVVDVRSGDGTASDGVFTRKFYFRTTTLGTSVPPCPEESDFATQGFTYSTYATSLSANPSESISFRFTVQAIDRQGNIDTSDEIPVGINGVFAQVSSQQLPCIVGPGTCTAPPVP